MDYIKFFIDHKRIITFGFLLTFFSSFGQTFLLSLYVPKIVDDFGLSNSFFGGLYAIATVASSFILVYAGRLIDNTDLRKYSLISAVLLMASCLILAVSVNIFMIFLGLLGLRFAGQGLMSHISGTTIAKNFDSSRGKALSITSLGYSSGEGFFPILVSMIIAYGGWRNSLLTNSAAIGVFLIPFIWFALPASGRQKRDDASGDADPAFRQRALFYDRRFYLLAINAVLLPFLVTGLFFYQSSLAAFKNWDMEWLSLSFIGFAVGRTVFSLLSGQLIDKFSAVKLLPFFFIPIIVGLITLLLTDHSYAAIVYLFLTGVSIGLGGNIKAAAIAEVYGKNNLGSIRSVFSTLMVLGTALSPLLFGMLIDRGFEFSFIIISGIVLLITVSLLSRLLAADAEYIAVVQN